MRIFHLREVVKKMVENLYYNKDGYKDPTAYMAMIKTGGKMMDWKDGMLVKMESFNGTVNYRVLIKVFDDHATTIAAYLSDRGESMSFVVDETRFYVNPDNLSYMQARNFASAEALGVIDDKDYALLLRKVAEGIGVRVADDFDEQWAILAKYQAENDRLKEEAESMKSELAMYKSSVARLKVSETELKEALDKAAFQPVCEIPVVDDVCKQERDLYKKLYEDLINKIVMSRTA